MLNKERNCFPGHITYGEWLKGKEQLPNSSLQERNVGKAHNIEQYCNEVLEYSFWKSTSLPKGKRYVCLLFWFERSFSSHVRKVQFHAGRALETYS